MQLSDKRIVLSQVDKTYLLAFALPRYRFPPQSIRYPNVGALVSRFLMLASIYRRDLLLVSGTLIPRPQ